MRRLSSIFASLAVLATGITLAAPVASANAAGGGATVKTAGMVAPSSVPNAQILRILRLNNSNTFLVVGIDANTAGANMHLWKIKEDLTLDSSFTPVDLGNDFEYPTASNSSCISNSSQSSASGACYRLENFIVNEAVNTYAIAFRRSLTASSTSTDLISIAVGNLTTGAVTAKSVFFPVPDATSPLATTFAAYNASDIVGTVCTSAFGSTYQGAPFFNGNLSSFAMFIRPDKSLIMSTSCTYSLSSGNGQNLSMTDHSPMGYFALKASGSALVRDNSWGTNGFVKTFDDPTKCARTWGGSSLDTSITSNSSPKIFTLVLLHHYPRVTMHPFNRQVTTYNGCLTSGMAATNGSSLMALTASGSVSASTDFATEIRPFRWIIDSSGRWNNTLMTGFGANATTSLFRLNTKGEPDTTLGPNGQKVLTGLPSTVTVNGTSVSMRYFFMGVATTASETLFTGFSSTSTAPSMFNCSQPTNYEMTMYPYYMSLDKGLVTGFGTNGLGQGVTTQYSTADSCGGNWAMVEYVNSKGQHAVLQVTRAIGSQPAGLKYTVWSAAAGVTSGGDGTGVVGGASAAGRVDTRVYSTRLPQVAQPDSALRVLTAKQAEDLDIRTSTPRICVALTTSVLMVNPGRCTVRIIDEDTRRVIRTMTTMVKKTEVEEGTTLTTDEPIMFRQASTTLSRAARAQVAELATAAANAGRVVVIGHSAALGDVSPFSFAISRDRATAVRNALIRAGVKAPIEIVALSYNQPERTAKTEAAQAKNRRVEVFIFPK